MFALKWKLSIAAFVTLFALDLYSVVSLWLYSSLSLSFSVFLCGSSFVYCCLLFAWLALINKYLHNIHNGLNIYFDLFANFIFVYFFEQFRNYLLMLLLLLELLLLVLNVY